jgi:hypothetical protein
MLLLLILKRQDFLQTGTGSETGTVKIVAVPQHWFRGCLLTQRFACCIQERDKQARHKARAAQA